MDRVKQQEEKERDEGERAYQQERVMAMHGLLSGLGMLGIAVRTQGNNLAFSGRRDKYAYDLQGRVKNLKPAILAWLRPRELADNLPETQTYSWTDMDTNYEAWEVAVQNMMSRAGLCHDHEERAPADPATEQEVVIIELLEDYRAHLQPEGCHSCGCRVYAGTYWRLRQQWQYGEQHTIAVNAGTPQCVRCFPKKAPKTLDYDTVCEAFDVCSLEELQTRLDAAWELILSLPRGMIYATQS